MSFSTIQPPVCQSLPSVGSGSDLSSLGGPAPSGAKPSLSLYTSANTVGYFVSTDSTFGNQILPVLPRF